MTRPRDPALWSAAEQAAAVRGGELTAVELLEACLARVERHNGELNAVVTLNPRVRAEAESVDRRIGRGEDPGPLAGLVVGIKDVTETAGIRTTYGSPQYEHHVPAEDALVVKRFREAGAVVLGKTNTPEFAAGGNTWNDVFGVTRNPWNPERSAGGSTGGGAAALATGMISLAQGTDLGGSLRIPASFCGVVGLRPTAGLVPTVPSAYLWDDLQVTGTMGRTAEDIALSLRALTGPDGSSPVVAPRWSGELADVEVALGRPLAYTPDLAGIGVDPEVAAACEAALEALRARGARIETVDLDLSWASEAFLSLRGHWFVSHLHASLDRIEDFGVNVAANLRSGLEVTMRQLGAAENARRGVRERCLELFRDFAGWLTPCMAVPPFPVEENYPREIAGRAMKTYVDWVAPTFLLSLSGLPVASVPAGLDAAGLPVGLQVVAPPLDEATALSLAAAVQSTRPLGPPPITG